MQIHDTVSYVGLKDAARLASSGSSGPVADLRALRDQQQQQAVCCQEQQDGRLPVIDAIWPPHQSAGDLLLNSLAHMMATLCSPRASDGLRQAPLAAAEVWLNEAWDRRQLHLSALKPSCWRDLLRGASPFLVLESAATAGGAPTSVVLQLHLQQAADNGMAPVTWGSDGGASEALSPAASSDGAFLLREAPGRPPGPQVNVLPDSAVVVVEGFDRLWLPERSPEDLMLYSLAEYMESRAWPAGVAGALSLPIAQAGMILTEFWKARAHHRGCIVKPLTTALLKGAHPYYSVCPRANNCASGDLLVVLHARRQEVCKPAVGGDDSEAAEQCAAGSRVNKAPVAAVVAAAMAAAAAATSDPAEQAHVAAAVAPLLAGGPLVGLRGEAAAAVDWRAVEAGIGDMYPTHSMRNLLKGCIIRIMLRRALKGEMPAAGGCPADAGPSPPRIGLKFADTCLRALLSRLVTEIPSSGDGADGGGQLTRTLVRGDPFFQLRQVASSGCSRPQACDLTNSADNGCEFELWLNGDIGAAA